MIHQPEFLPWTGLFLKMAACDVFVFLDNVQYLRRSYQNRNRIKNRDGQQWLTVPLKRAPREQRIMDMNIDVSKDWQQSHVSALKGSYKSAAYYKEVWPLLEPAYEKQWSSLVDLDCFLTESITHGLGLNPRFVRASELNIKGVKAERILNICLELKANRYISGMGGKTYLDEKDFQKHDVEIVYIPPFEMQYQQLCPEKEFMAGLSIIDYLFNRGIGEVRQTLIQLAQQHLSHGKLSVHA